MSEAESRRARSEQTARDRAGPVAPIVSKEDAIVSKLLWIQQGSHRSRHDVKEMLSATRTLTKPCSNSSQHPWMFWIFSMSLTQK